MGLSRHDGRVQIDFNYRFLIYFFKPDFQEEQRHLLLISQDDSMSYLLTQPKITFLRIMTLNIYMKLPPYLVMLNNLFPKTAHSSNSDKKSNKKFHVSH